MVFLFYFFNFASIEDEKKMYPMMDLSKFTSNKKISSRVVVISYKVGETTMLVPQIYPMCAIGPSSFKTEFH